MKTEAEAKKLWCPMVRIIQIGAVEAHGTYNRAFVKSHFPVKLADASEEFELGKDIKEFNASVLRTETQLPAASKCIASDCAMWRSSGELGYCGIAGRPEVSA